MRAARRHLLEQSGCANARPTSRKPSQRARLVIVVDTILSPREAPVGQRELLSKQRVERMRNPESLRSIGRITCS